MYEVTVQERRRAPRASYDERIMVRTDRGVIPAMGGNVSECGMLLHTHHGDEDVDRRLWLSFTLPRVPHVLQLEAEVVHERLEGEQRSLGVRFMQMPPIVRRMLRTYVFTGRGRVKDYMPA